MAKILKSLLYCLKCEKETPHRLEYVGGILKKITCETCSFSLSLPKDKLIKYYAEEVLHRILTKPEKISHELREDLNAFLKSLPTRILTKPFRVAKEIKEILEKE